MAGGPKMAAQSGAAMPAVPAKPAAPATTAKAAVATAAPVTASGPAALPKPANPNLVIQRPLTQIIASNAGNLRPQASGAAILGGIRVVENANTLNIPTGVTRREFLNYVWGASMALLLAESTALTLLFAFPRFRAGEFGGKIKTALADFPKQLGDPIANEVGKFWMVFTNAGLMAHYKICTHLGCIFKWDAAAKIFACPCHGSQFNYDGTYHAGPAPRGLDHFQFELLDAGEKVLYATTAGEPVDISKYPNAVFMNVNTGGKVTGIAR